MISLNNITVAFGGVPLFDHVSFIINTKDRIGLTGKNGTGKTTLLKIITGLKVPDEGDVVIPDGQTIGYLPQEMKVESALTVLEEAMTAFSEIGELKERVEAFDRELRSRDDFESPDYHRLIRNHADAIERYHFLEGQSIHVNAEKVLTGLGFVPEEFSRPLNQFSSGWRMRVEIAKILLRQPDVVLLDEPTNHLDIESIQWLEEFLAVYNGAVVLVSHDRTFLDNVTTRTIEISLGKIYDYKANYSEYVRMREERLESQVATFNNQQRQIRQIERFVERFRYKATKARQVQSRIKMLEKIDEVELDLVDESGIHFRFPPAPHAGKIILEAKDLGKAYDGKKVLQGIGFTVVKQDRIAFVGKNGEGKTTLSKILARHLDHTGQLRFGHNVVTGYYAQDQSELLDPGKTVFKTIDDIATGEIRPRIRALLGGFLFSGDSIEKKVRVLSGGEKSRLALAKLLLTPSNLLILDEPTNHLDMQSKDILKDALLGYDGTLIIVSHDRDFLQGLTNKVFEFRQGEVREYIGDIFDFLESRKLRTLSQLEEANRSNRIPEDPETVSAAKMNREKRKLFEREVRKLKTRIERTEQEIEKLEKEIREQEEALADPDRYREILSDKNAYSAYQQLKTGHSKRMAEWEELQVRLEVLEKQNPDQ